MSIAVKIEEHCFILWLSNFIVLSNIVGYQLNETLTVHENYQKKHDGFGSMRIPELPKNTYHIIDNCYQVLDHLKFFCLPKDDRDYELEQPYLTSGNEYKCFDRMINQIHSGSEL